VARDKTVSTEMSISTSSRDEEQPLLRRSSEMNRITERSLQYGVVDFTSSGLTPPTDAIVVDFDPLGDPDNPLDWATSFKWTIVGMLAMMAFTV